MVDLNFLKNPIILAILMAIVTYAYMYWENMKKKEKNPKADIEPVEYTTPAIVGLLTLVGAYVMFGSSNSAPEKIEIECQPNEVTDKIVESFDSNTFHLVGKNAIRLPQSDVFIDIARF